MKRFFFTVEQYFYGDISSNAVIPNTETHQLLNCFDCSRPHNNIKLISHVKRKSVEKWAAKLDLTMGFCGKCYKQFDTDEAQRHQICHSDGARNVCQICVSHYPSDMAFLDHMVKNHRPMEMPYRCALCSYKSSVFDKYEDHFAKYHIGSEFTFCLFCLKVFSSSKDYVEHVWKHSNQQSMFDCPFCRLQFLTYEEKHQHMKNDHVSMLTDLDDLDVSMLQAVSNANIPKDLVKCFKNYHVTITLDESNGEECSITAPEIPIIDSARIKFFDRICSECSTILSDNINGIQKHFSRKKLLRCEFCAYKTSCFVAYERHKATHGEGNIKVAAVRKTKQSGKNTKNHAGDGKKGKAACSITLDIDDDIYVISDDGGEESHKEKSQHPVPTQSNDKQNNGLMKNTTDKSKERSIIENVKSTGEKGRLDAVIAKSLKKMTTNNMENSQRVAIVIPKKTKSSSLTQIAAEKIPSTTTSSPASSNTQRKRVRKNPAPSHVHQYRFGRNSKSFPNKFDDPTLQKPMIQLSKPPLKHAPWKPTQAKPPPSRPKIKRVKSKAVVTSTLWPGLNVVPKGSQEQSTNQSSSGMTKTSLVNPQQDILNSRFSANLTLSAAPSQVTFHYVTSSSFIISWKKPITPISGYTLVFKGNGFPTTRLIENAKASHLRLVGLKSGTNYNIKLTALIDGKEVGTAEAMQRTPSLDETRKKCSLKKPTLCVTISSDEEAG